MGLIESFLGLNKLGNEVEKNDALHFESHFEQAVETNSPEPIFELTIDLYFYCKGMKEQERKKFLEYYYNKISAMNISFDTNEKVLVCAMLRSLHYANITIYVTERMYHFFTNKMTTIPGLDYDENQQEVENLFKRLKVLP